MLEIKNLTKKYDSRIILNNVSFEVKNGEIALLLGASGVGKSTLLRILNNLEEYNSGTIKIDNQIVDLTQINKNHSVGMVFQQFNLFQNLSVEENITFALEKVENKIRDQAKKIAQELLERFGLSEKANLFPKDLSGGQKQRLAIARSIALKPRVICFDEPTSALDPMLTSFVASNIQELANDNYIVLVATHDIGLIEKLDCKIYLMQNGSIVESTNSKEFLENKNNYPKIKKFVES